MEEERETGEKPLGPRKETVLDDPSLGLDNRIRVLPTEAHSCGMGLRLPWSAPLFLRRGELLPRKGATLQDVRLEIVVRVAVSASVSGTWQATFPLDCEVPLPPGVQPWMGRSLLLQGEVTVEGTRESRRRVPEVAWAGSGRYKRFGLPRSVGLAETTWAASLLYGPRSNAELWGVAVRVMRCEEVVVQSPPRNRGEE